MEVERLKQELELSIVDNDPVSHRAEDDVEASLALFDEIEKVAGDPAGRLAVLRLIGKLNTRITLNFTEGSKKTRKVRVLAGGVIGFGLGLAKTSCGCGHENEIIEVSGGVLPPPADGEETPSVGIVCQPKGVSSTKVNRGDRI